MSLIERLQHKHLPWGTLASLTEIGELEFKLGREGMSESSHGKYFHPQIFSVQKPVKKINVNEFANDIIDNC